tara:strand:- start:582 stop:863 length:282 start_codon:yes stop_codon:yes gene_type:complete
LLDEIKPSFGLKNQRLTTKSSSGKIQKNMLAAKVAIKNAIIRRSDFAADEKGLDRGALMTPADALANLQKTCRFEPCKLLDEAADVGRRTCWS